MLLCLKHFIKNFATICIGNCENALITIVATSNRFEPKYYKLTLSYHKLEKSRYIILLPSIYEV